MDRSFWAAMGAVGPFRWMELRGVNIAALIHQVVALRTGGYKVDPPPSAAIEPTARNTAICELTASMGIVLFLLRHIIEGNALCPLVVV